MNRLFIFDLLNDSVDCFKCKRYFSQSHSSSKKTKNFNTLKENLFGGMAGLTRHNSLTIQ